MEIGTPAAGLRLAGRGTRDPDAAPVPEAPGGQHPGWPSSDEGDLRWVHPPGLEFLGPMQGSGLRATSYLVRRVDGQTVQVSELVHLVLESVQPDRAASAVAARVSAAYGRELSADGLVHLVSTKLEPLGLLTPVLPSGPSDPDDPSSSEWRTAPVVAPRAKPLLSLTLRGVILPPPVVWFLGGLLRPLFWPPVVVLAVVTAVGLDWFLLGVADAGAALDQVLGTPSLLLGLWVVLTAGGVFHELGHGTACRYGGARPGGIGFGVYLLFPAFYTDVTDSYRLPRAARLRVDLGGLYFNVLSVLALGALYLWTGNGLFLLALLVTQLEMIQQLVPAVRLDGYYVLADLAGVPDLFARVGPVLRSLRPGAPTDPRVAELRPSARRVVVAWVLTVTPLLIAGTAWLVWHIPTIIDSNVDAVRDQATQLQQAVREGDAVRAALTVIAILLLLVPLLGLGVLVVRLGESFLRLLGSRATAAARRHDPSATTSRSAALERPSPDSKETAMSSSTDTRNHVAPSAGTRGPVTEHRTAAALAGAAPPTGLSAGDFRDDLMLPPQRPAPSFGWRRALYRASGQTVNLGPGPEERRRAELEERLRAPVTGSRRIVVMSRKGGVGKTTMSFALGSTFAALRGDRVIAVDANPDAGNLAHRVSRPNERTITDVLSGLDGIQTYAQLRSYTSQAAESRLEVLASDDDPRIGMALARDDYHRLIGLLDRFYNLIVLDTGTGILDSANQGLLAEADQIVLVSRPGIDGGRAAALTLDWLDQHEHEDLVRSAVVVINGVRPGVGAPLEPIVDHFERRCSRVVTVPWDPALEMGAQTQLSALRGATRHGLVEVAAAVADDFANVRADR
jgi:putative peptide zinc metalloprotease protein